MKAIYLYVILTILAGALIPLQAGLNAKMGKAINDPVYAALISFVVGSIGLLIYGLLTKMDFLQISNASNVHPTVWTAGLLGAIYVTAIIVFVPKIGATLTFGLVITGQLGVSIMLDHYGWLGVPVHTVSWQRLLGILSIILGVILIRVF